jgi:fructose-1,6-bisphosphatase I
MERIFSAVMEIGKRIDRAIKTGETGKANTSNLSGDQQVKLDIVSDRIVEEVLKGVGSVAEIISEEKEGPVQFREKGYKIAYDPLDGSSLVDVNLSVGSIFGIYDGDYNGSNLVGAAYVVYGPRLEVVTATQRGVNLYRLKDGEFQLVGPVQLKEKGKILAPGGTQAKWLPFHKEMIDGLFKEGYRLRYSGGMVPDLHQVLLKGGGLFSYPATTDKPAGKLRKLFEVFPFAFIFTKAGGEAVDGVRPLLELGYSNYHDTTPCFFGSRYEIGKVKEVYSANL